jgi:hypothetical protein
MVPPPLPIKKLLNTGFALATYTIRQSPNKKSSLTDIVMQEMA